ncbi:glycosyltransferase family 2 protein [Paractinoplanes atraurantiacus]|uniref:Glycosyl transferase family 2 n=1 Tax=Paractinoplanes atraurantiacus TaxID=1036182 RepID=A0A285IVG8_9ACTN|nr:glycosyltransferase family A protein [Actinoplanes atraurantiacus]SNY52050.1 Glycosyl transferase family 2 [Actinoplanes atraurantiacus]
MPTVSVITAAYAPSAAYLAETVASVDAQRLPHGWDLEWIVQEDGAAPSLAHHFARAPYVRYEANGAQLGIAATRNLGLSRATGDLIQVLDSDDMLLPGALESLIPKFDEHRIHWAIGQADDLMPDGSRVEWPSAFPDGIVPAGSVNRHAEEHGGNWPIHCAGLLLRAVTLRAIGGWVGLPSDEDIAMFAALSQISDGYNLDGKTWLYRQHPQQITRASTTRHLSEDCRRFALQRAKAIEATGLKFDGNGQFRFDTSLHQVAVGEASKEHLR